MSKKVTAFIQKELEKRFEDVNECVVVSCRGVDGNENNRLRGGLRDKQIRMNVVKNSLAARAFAKLGNESIGELFTGPCAIVYGGDSIVDVAKEMVDWSKQIETLEIKGGFLEGTVLDVKGISDLAKLPSRGELQGSIVQLAQSPGASIAGALNSPGSRIAGAIKALVEKLEATESEAA